MKEGADKTETFRRGLSCGGARHGQKALARVGSVESLPFVSTSSVIALVKRQAKS